MTSVDCGPRWVFCIVGIWQRDLREAENFEGICMRCFSLRLIATLRRGIGNIVCFGLLVLCYGSAHTRGQVVLRDG